jgi:hypothetical protein
MPMFFWLPVIIFGGIWKIAVESAPDGVSRTPTAGEDDRDRQRCRP